MTTVLMVGIGLQVKQEQRCLRGVQAVIRHAELGNLGTLMGLTQIRTREGFPETFVSRIRSHAKFVVRELPYESVSHSLFTS